MADTLTGRGFIAVLFERLSDRITFRWLLRKLSIYTATAAISAALFFTAVLTLFLGDTLAVRIAEIKPSLESKGISEWVLVGVQVIGIYTVLAVLARTIWNAIPKILRAGLTLHTTISKFMRRTTKAIAGSIPDGARSYRRR